MFCSCACAPQILYVFIDMLVFIWNYTLFSFLSFFTFFYFIHTWMPCNAMHASVVLKNINNFPRIKLTQIVWILHFILPVLHNQQQRCRRCVVAKDYSTNNVSIVVSVYEILSLSLSELLLHSFYQKCHNTYRAV